MSHRLDRTCIQVVATRQRILGPRFDGHCALPNLPARQVQTGASRKRVRGLQSLGDVVVERSMKEPLRIVRGVG